MTRKTILIICLAAAAMGVSMKGFAQEKITVDKIVANVGNSAILYSDVVETEQQLIMSYRMQGYTPPSNTFYTAFEQLLEIKLGYNQALLDSLTIDEGSIPSYVDEIIRDQVADAGSVTQLEAVYNMPIYDIRDIITRRKKEQDFYRSMRQDVMRKVKITPGEVEAYYKSFPKDSIPVVPDQYMYAQITKYPPSMTEAKQRVKERMLSMREEIISGKSKFETLAILYSQDTESAKRGGELLQPLARMEMVEPFSGTVAKLKPGQVSEVVETDNGFHIIETLGMVGDRYRIRHIVLTPTYTTEEITSAVIQLDSLVTKIRQDSVSFERAAMKHSDDKATRMNGGLVTNTERLAYENGGYVSAGMTSFRFKREDFGNNYLDYQMLVDMKPGDVSDAYESRDFKGNVQAKVIKLLEFYPTHEANLAEDYLVLESEALERKMMDEYDRWLKKTIAATFIRIDPAYRDGINPKWLK